MVTVWGKKGCTNAKKGVVYLEDRGVDFELREITKDPPPRELLERNLDPKDLKGAVNTRSRPYRELGLKDGLPDKRKLVDLMLEHPDLIKRPVVANAGRASFGPDPAAIDGVLDAES